MDFLKNTKTPGLAPEFFVQHIFVTIIKTKIVCSSMP